MTFSGPPEIPFGEVRTVFSPAVSETLAVWQASMEMAPFRVVTRHWDLLSELETVLDDTLEALARAALGIWPAWYNAPMDSIGSNGRPEAADPAERNLDGSEKKRQRPLNRSWFEATSSLCRNNEIPLSRKFPREVQAEQLAVALDTNGLMIVMSGREERRPVTSFWGRT